MGSVTLFGITIPVDPVAFTLPWGWSVYWYGILIATGVLLALLYGMKNGNRFGIKPDHIFDTFLVVLPVSILGARAYYILFEAEASFSNFFNFNGHGFTGLAIYGGVIAAAVSIIIMQRIYKFNLLAALDITSVGFLIGQSIGRWGNFVNQEAYGELTGSTWFGMSGSEIGDQLVHPCFLYESLWCAIGFFVLHHFSKKRKYKGQIALMYGAWYGFERAFVETLRTDSLFIPGTEIRVSSLFSALLCVACVVVLVVMEHKLKQNKIDKTYEPVFTEDSNITSVDLPLAVEVDANAENQEELDETEESKEALEENENADN